MSDKETKTPPKDFPTAVQGGPLDHVLRVESLIALQGSVGELKEAVRTLQKETEKHSGKLDAIGQQLSTAKAILIIAGLVISGAISVFAFVANKLFDVALKHWGG